MPEFKKLSCQKIPIEKISLIKIQPNWTPGI